MFEGLFQLAFLLVELMVSILVEFIQLLLTIFSWRFLLCISLGLVIGFLASRYFQKDTLTTTAFWAPTTVGLSLGIIWSLRKPKH